MERLVRVLAVFFWVAATLFVALLFTAGLSYDFSEVHIHDCA
jgi:hypothetical protein